MIKRITPSKIIAQFEDKTITIEGEAIPPGDGSPNYIIYSNSISGWDPPHHGMEFTNADKDLVVAGLKRDLDQRNISFVIE